MVTVAFHESFRRRFSRLKSPELKERILKQVAKIRENPSAGKPMRYMRRGTRELWIPPFRLSYLYEEREEKIVLLEMYHKDAQ